MLRTFSHFCYSAFTSKTKSLMHTESHSRTWLGDAVRTHGSRLRPSATSYDPNSFTSSPSPYLSQPNFALLSFRLSALLIQFRPSAGLASSNRRPVFSSSHFPNSPTFRLVSYVHNSIIELHMKR